MNIKVKICFFVMLVSSLRQQPFLAKIYRNMADLEAKPSIYQKILASSGLVSFLWAATIVTIIITFIITYFKARSGLSTVALHYNVIIGVDMLGKSWELFFIPLSSTGIGIINYLVYRFAIPKGDFLGTLTALSSWLVALILCTALLFLFSVN